MIERIARIVAEATGEKDVHIEIPEAEEFGHYATSVAMKLAKNAGKNPLELAEELAARIKAGDNEHIFEKVLAVSPGFVNIWLSTKTFQEEVAAIIKQGEKYGVNELGKKKKARIEYVSANPTGPIHIGNVRGGPIGETLCRVLERSGYKVLREYIHNDVGNQVEKLGKSLWYWYEKKRGNDIPFPEGGYPGEYLSTDIDVAREKFGDKLTETDISKLVAFELEHVLQENCATLKRIGIEFDLIVKESEFISSGKAAAAVKFLKKEKLAVEKEGALWFAPNDEFLEDREAVIIRSDGRPTYFASDIAYHQEKFTSGYDLVVDIFGSNHHGHVPKLQALAKLFGFDIAKFSVILYQYVRLKKGDTAVRMQKREGNFVTAKTVLDEVGADNLIFFLLLQGANSHIDFDLELAKTRSMENPVYYVQYAYVRAKSILREAGGFSLRNADYTQLERPSELRLIRKLVSWPDIVQAIAKDFAVQRITRYALQVARAFNAFYESERVLGEPEEIMRARLALVSAAGIILKDVFHVLAISAPEKM